MIKYDVESKRHIVAISRNCESVFSLELEGNENVKRKKQEQSI